MTPIPPPDAYEDAIPPYGIRKPKAGAPANRLPLMIDRIAEDVTEALVTFGLPPVITGTPVVAASQTARDAHWGIPINATQRLALQNLGAKTIRTDLGYEERYFATITDGGTNPGGAMIPGWYPTEQVELSQWLTANLALPNATTGDGTDVKLSGSSHNRLGQFLSYDPTTGIYTCLRAASFRFILDLLYDANATGTRLTRFWFKALASDTTWSAQKIDNHLPADRHEVNLTWDIPLSVGNVVKITARQNSGGALALVGSANFPSAATAANYTSAITVAYRHP